MELSAPTPAQNAAYRRALQIERSRFDERRAGRSGYLPAALEAEARDCDAVISAALSAGVGFDRMSFGDVEAA